MDYVVLICHKDWHSSHYIGSVSCSAQRKQLEDIFKMMEQNKDKFGVDSFQELEDQMKLYSK